MLGIVAIYVVFPKIAGFEDSLEKMDDATWYWIVVAIGFNFAAFAAYVALFKGVLGGSIEAKVHERLDARTSYQITMAGLAATRIFSAAGVGGLVVTYWALRKAGHGAPPRGLPDGGVPRAHVLLLPRGADHLRGAAAHRRAARQQPAGRHDRAGGDRGRRARRCSGWSRSSPATSSAGWPSSRRATGVALRQAAGHRPGHARDRRSHRDRIRPPPEARLPRDRRARSGSGRRTSGSCGRASRRTAATCRSACWSRASSSAWRPT